MTPKAQGSDLPCLNPACPNTITQSPSGRRRLYCRDACGRAYRRWRDARSKPEETGDFDAYAIQVAEETAHHLGQILPRTRAGDPLEALRYLSQARIQADDLTAALVQQARAHGHRSRDIAKAMNISVHKLSRDYSIEACARRRRRRTGV